MVGARGQRACALTHPHVAGIVSPGVGARVWQGRVARPCPLRARAGQRPAPPGCRRQCPRRAVVVSAVSLGVPGQPRAALRGVWRGLGVLHAPSGVRRPRSTGRGRSCGPGGAPRDGAGGSLGGQSTRIGGQPPNTALEPTPTAFAALRLSARLTASVRRQRRGEKKPRDQPQRNAGQSILSPMDHRERVILMACALTTSSVLTTSPTNLL